MAKILHIVESLTLGGGCRAMFAKAKYSQRKSNHQHTVASLLPTDTASAQFRVAQENGMQVLVGAHDEILRRIPEFDIVELQWWNNPRLGDFLRRADLPAMRLLAWMHVGGNQASQVVTPSILEFVDFAVACSPYTYECNAMQALPPEVRQQKVGMAYGAADFARLEGCAPRPHHGFKVGYIGTIDYLKMHRNYVAMSAAINIPDVRFVICGLGGATHVIQHEAKQRGISERFMVLGYVEDIRSQIEEFDVYGYPLCEETYAASEINLQEVMYAGVPVVVFPYGGVRRLVVNDFTGYIVHSELEYKQAIEYLYHHPEERSRLGKNAHEYAKQIFSAERAAEKFDQYYEALLRQPKRERGWRDVVQWKHPVHQLGRGTQNFLVSIGAEAADVFLTSIFGASEEEVIAAERKIAAMPALMRDGGVRPYHDFYPNEPYPALWAGLMLLAGGDVHGAMNELARANQAGLNHWRCGWYLAQAAEQCGRADIANLLYQRLSELGPGVMHYVQQGAATRV